MITQANLIHANSEITAKFCIVGAGPAGITLANELSAWCDDILILESGRFPYNREKRIFKAMLDHLSGPQSLARGQNVGEPYYPIRLSRARGIGGSTTGKQTHLMRLRPFDALDLEGILGPGWPVPYSELARFIPQTDVYNGLSVVPENPGENGWEARPSSVLQSHFDTVPLRYGPKDQYAQMQNTLGSKRQIHCLLGANVIRIRTGANDDKVEHLEVKALDGTPFTVKADIFVLCAGGLDGPRVMLNSPDLLRAMGPAANAVGRYFMEHPHYTAGYVVPDSRDAFDTIHEETCKRDNDTMQPLWTANDATVREHQLPRVSFIPTPVSESSLQPGIRAAGELYRLFPFGPFTPKTRLRQLGRAVSQTPQVLKVVASRFKHSDNRQIFALPVMAEQAPLADSRVTLSHKTDRLGLPLPIFDWKMADSDFTKTSFILDLMDRELKKANLGHIVSIMDEDGGVRPDIIPGGWHHMGATRMSKDPQDGVVDPDCRVHGTENMYIAGSGVFPTGGFANPTHTLVILTLRLAEHLKATASDHFFEPTMQSE